jgi:histidyl-tRNA synthetase
MLKELGMTDEVIAKIFEFLGINGQTLEIIGSLKKMSINNDQFLVGIDELECVMSNIQKLGVPLQYFGIDLSIARGLDYYTGTVYETVLIDYPKLGSVCSGGRYDNLADKYTTKKLPGVGISIGLTRLFSQLKEARLISTGKSTYTSVLVIPFVDDLTISLIIATELRNKGVSTEVYFEEAKFNKKMAYADKLGIPFVVIVGEDEVKSGLYTVKNMKTGEQVKVSIDKIFENIQPQ